MVQANPDIRLIDVYPYRIEAGIPLFLLLRRAPGVIYSGQWRMVGGKVHEAETSHEAAVREFREETSLGAVKAWVIPTVNAFYDPKADQIRYIPTFAVECEPGKVRLNHEHDDFGWFKAENAAELLVWHEQKRILGIVHDIITSNSVLTEWLLPV